VSKDAIRTFTRFVAEEEREWNVCVVAFSPKQAIATEDAPEEARKRLPGPECLGNGFVLAAQAGMELTGKTVEHRDGNLVAVDSLQRESPHSITRIPFITRAVANLTPSVKIE